MMDFYYKLAPFEMLCITGYKGKDKHVEFPKNLKITILHDGVFKGKTEIESVKIPDTVMEIGGFVFEGCTNLKAIDLPPNLQNMWQYAFTRTSIEEITIPGTVERIVPYTFNESRALKKVLFQEGTKKISARAFKNCTALEDVYLSSTITNISDEAFEGCGNIKFHKVKNLKMEG